MNSEQEEVWSQIQSKLQTALEPESRARVLFYLTNEFNTHQRFGPACNVLQTLLEDEKGFIEFARHLAHNSRDDPDRDAHFQVFLELMESKLNPESLPLHKYLNHHVDLSVKASATSSTLARMSTVASCVAKNVKIRPTMFTVDDVVGLANSNLAVGITVVVSGVFLTYDAIKNLRLYYKGEISGRTCARNIVRSVLGTAAGAAGSFVGAAAGGKVGAAVGSLAGPVGILIGGVVGVVVGGFFGSVAASHIISSIINYISEKFFSIPKDEQLQRAYEFFGLDMTATDREVQSAYLRKCLQHHPDKGGQKEDFLLVQMHMNRIQIARGKKGETTRDSEIQNRICWRNMCITCEERTANTVFDPCGHMCLCFDCSTRLGQLLQQRPGARTCPVCRQEYAQIIRVFRS